ncbi:stage VI sporulation protein D [Paenibacillus antibioticophila]|uniref:Stage VI sporulation protein D n=1 Tax=Paenibacillus antibioticophila TaxID=1274374 RepID=A0A920CJV9_9BACL|nr:LysM peptidoglycan-binding domain-containing protein [Paenibacillus antibioticophila]GIO39864.1 stage VI sporulation protein D [Paenibacillus antibioticophila]
MADQSYGLRFDIYERVHLGENVAGIEELEEMELVPRIQVIPGEDYASLRGHLLLSGVYSGEEGTHQLEHWIPVEITIPLSRVGKLEDIAVEIDNFDVDLLSSKSLNITGVLSLHGVESASRDDSSDEWKEREFTAAYEPGADAKEQAVQESLTEWGSGFHSGELERSYTEHFRSWEQEAQQTQPGQDEQASPLSWNDEESPLFSRADFADKKAESASSWNEQETDEDDDREIAQEVELEFHPLTPASDPAGESPEEHLDRERELQTQPALSDSEPVMAYEEPVQEEAPAPIHEALPNEELDLEPEIEENAAPAQEEKKEMKIALGSKKPENSANEGHFGLSKLLKGKRQTVEEIPSEQAQAELNSLADEGLSEEEIRWKNLFIRNGEEQTPFRKVKLVIVQREETLDEIADRYQLSSRELQLYNRLSENHLAEGQVLYIP